jgi:mono/diheme cytochrome c family protein
MGFFLTIGGGILYFYLAYPKVSPAPEITIEPTTERLARGEYLFHHVSMCVDCHSERNFNYFSAPVIEGTEGKGGFMIPGAPGKIYASNITSAALGDWTDGEILQAITAGISRDGRPLAPMMPYMEYRHLSKEDAYAVVAYMKTLKPIENKVPQTSLNFPLNLIFRTIPTDYEPRPHPDTSDSRATGEYLSIIAGCQFCHSPVDKGILIPGKEFSGGHDFEFPSMGIVRAANLTPDRETGIGNWNREMFIARFKAYADSTARFRPVVDGGFQSPMPWTLLAGMTEEDLGAIYDYLSTLQPVRNKVKKLTPIE